MSQIKSSANLAAKHATALNSGLANLANSTEKKDQTSSLQGNEKAKARIDKAAIFASAFKSKASTFVRLIHSTSSEFQAMDKQLSQEMKKGT